jgi:hypothetical protein
MKILLLLPLLFLLSCDEDDNQNGKLRISIENSSDAKCLKKVFAEHPDFALAGIEKADILASLDSNLTFKNAKTGSMLQYKRQQTIFGFCDFGCDLAILGYEISNCDFAKKHAGDLANLSVAEWDLDSNANGKMYISADNRLQYSRQRWIAQILNIGEDVIRFDSREGGSMQFSSTATDSLAEFLDSHYKDSQNSIGVEDYYLDNTIFIYTDDAPYFDNLAKVIHAAREAGYSDIIYNPVPQTDSMYVSDIDYAKGRLNYLYHGSKIRYGRIFDEDDYDKEILRFFSSDMVGLLSLVEKHGVEKGDIRNYLRNFFCNPGLDHGYCEFDIDFETKSAKPVRITAKMLKCQRITNCESAGEVLFHFVKENEEMKISDAEASGVSLKKTLRNLP